jgi:hypothetical protein
MAEQDEHRVAFREADAKGRRMSRPWSHAAASVMSTTRASRRTIQSRVGRVTREAFCRIGVKDVEAARQGLEQIVLTVEAGESRSDLLGPPKIS